MLNKRDIDKRLCLLEDQVLSHCNCRVATPFHDATCLKAILKRQSVPCPVHEFRFLGPFFRVPMTEPVLRADRECCPCPAVADSDPELDDDPVKSFRHDFRVQRRLFKKHITGPQPFLNPLRAMAAILGRLKTTADGLPDLSDLPPEDKEPFRLAMARDMQALQWRKETGRSMPRPLEILNINIRRDRRYVEAFMSSANERW